MKIDWQQTASLVKFYANFISEDLIFVAFAVWIFSHRRK
jgi:hypothetical protein